MKHWKQILAPVLVFVLGAICGGGATALYAIHKIREFAQAPPAESSEIGARRLAQRLGLDAEQRVAAQPILRDLAVDLARIRQQSMPEVSAAINDAAERLRPLLRPRQQRQLDTMLERPRARWRQAPERERLRQRGTPAPPAAPP